MARLYSGAPSAARGGALDWVSFKAPPTAGKTQGIPLAVAQTLSGAGEVLSTLYVQAESSDAITTVIADGHHVAPEMLRLVAASAPGRWAMITDATAAAGMPDGAYRLAGVPLTVEDGAVRDAVVRSLVCSGPTPPEE